MSDFQKYFNGDNKALSLIRYNTEFDMIESTTDEQKIESQSDKLKIEKKTNKAKQKVKKLIITANKVRLNANDITVDFLNNFDGNINNLP